MENVKRDYYGIIGVPRSASQVEIEAKCLRLGERYHPERDPGDAEAARKFEAVEHAYAVLTDRRKRAAYDQELAAPPYTPAIAPEPSSGGHGVWVVAGAAGGVLITLGVWFAVSGHRLISG